MSTGSVRMSLTPLECAQLRRLVDEFSELIGPDSTPEDPAVARLTPSAYPDDSGAARDFRSATRADLIARRADDARIVNAALSSTENCVTDNPAEWMPAAALSEQELEIPASDVDSWMRTLTAIRLVLATRIGIIEEQDHDPADVRFTLYDWLGYRLETLVQAADDQLD
ncbi:MAG: DUF2017 family protein [Microbacterium sp.]